MQKYVGFRIPSSFRRSSALAQERGNASVVGGTNSNRPTVAWSDEETREEEEEKKGPEGGKGMGGRGFDAIRNIFVGLIWENEFRF